MPDHPRRTVLELTVTSARPYPNPFTDVTLTATFTDPAGAEHTIEGFFIGGGTWQVRFNPGVTGAWHWRTTSTPPDPELTRTGSFTVSESAEPGFVQSTPGQAWGFTRENGDPVFIFGDTVYHLFGVAHNDPTHATAVERFLERRAAQGFNLLRIRVPVSEFHPDDGYNVWQTRSLWPWRGSPQAPRFDEFNLDYFATVDRVVAQCERLGIGIELIIEAWGFEFPFNDRNRFTAAWEDLWIRYLVARYDAFNALWFWQLHNEYEYYPNGDWHYDRSGVADRWAIQIAHRVRQLAPHGHPIAIHNGPELPPLADRFRSDPTAIDTVMYQTWGTTGETDGWLAAGIETRLDEALTGWPGSKVLAEWGYEFNPDLPPMMLGHRWCDADHTRRGAWRGAMRAMGIIHGFENSWGPFAELDAGQPGLDHLLHVRRFFTEIVPFADLRPDHTFVAAQPWPRGHAPLTVANPDRSLAVIYLPVGGGLTLAEPAFTSARWFDPRTGTLHPEQAVTGSQFTAPDPSNAARPEDWVLLLRRQA